MFVLSWKLMAQLAGQLGQQSNLSLVAKCPEYDN